MHLVSFRGIPDIIGLVNGRFVAIELKVKKNKPDKLQAFILKKIQAAGGLAYTAYPHNIDDILKDIQILTTGEHRETRLVSKC